MKKVSKELGKFIAAVRTAQGLSQRAFAEKLDVSASHLARLELGEKGRYPIDFLNKLSEKERRVAFDILCNYLKEDLEL